jgi:16S rRNA (guanine527-N7)-methyltransferase
VTDRPRDFSATQDGPLLLELAETLGAAPSPVELAALTRYVELVVSWNKKLDLTAARGARAQLEVLLVDSLVLARPEIIPLGSSCIDVGSGAGAPALPLMIVRPDLRATLIEPLRKRVAFLRTAIGSLGLVERVKLQERKLDPDPPPSAAAPALPGAPFDVAFSRATFAPEVWLPAALRLAPRGLALLAGQAPAQLTAAGSLLASHAYALPWSGAPRTIAVYAG